MTRKYTTKTSIVYTAQLQVHVWVLYKTNVHCIIMSLCTLLSSASLESWSIFSMCTNNVSTNHNTCQSCIYVYVHLCTLVFRVVVSTFNIGLNHLQFYLTMEPPKYNTINTHIYTVIPPNPDIIKPDQGIHDREVSLYFSGCYNATNMCKALALDMS